MRHVLYTTEKSLPPTNSVRWNLQKCQAPWLSDIHVLPGIDPGYIRLPQSKIKYVQFIGVMLSCEKIENF
jgi:hypothetical protein